MRFFTIQRQTASRFHTPTRLGRAAAFLQLLSYKIVFLLLLAGGSFEGGLIEESPSFAVESFKECSGCSTLFRTASHGRFNTHNTIDQIVLNCQPILSVSSPSPASRHIRFSLPNGGCAPLRC